MDNEFTDLILKFTCKAGLALTERQARLLSGHIQLMLEWNLRLNLTRITGREEIIVKHLLDCILPAKFLPSSGYALDVGTGAGFPGIPLKIVYPDLQMVLLDSSRKKVSFLSAVAAALGLKGIRVLHGRWQDLSNVEEHANKFELITMRALRLEPEHIRCLASMVLCPGGVLAWWGAGDQERLAGRQAGCGGSETVKRNYFDMEFQDDLKYLLPGIKQQRAVWLWRKTGIGTRGDSVT
ncbi:MAG: 16S rRNA (guanine(527)-N(7))-methyltransferase RsmG [Syntrophobacteraceae bacterium]